VSTAERRLPPGYYLDNFETVLDDVERRQGRFLREEERAFLDGFRAMGQDARRLYVRLLTRRGPWFRVDELEYEEVDRAAALTELVNAGFAEFAHGEAVDERLESMPREELREWLRELGLKAPATSRRDALANACRKAAAAPDVAERLAQRVALVRLLRAEVLRVFRLLFFGNLGQDWTEFVLRDLGILRFEPVLIAEDASAFSTREALDEVLTLRRHAEATERALAAGDLAGAVAIAEGIAGGAWRGPSRRRADAVLLPVARELERRGEVSRALALYAAAQSPPARERRARLVAARGGLAEAARLCREIAAEPRDESERVFAGTFGARLESRRAGGKTARRRAPAPDERVLRARLPPTVDLPRGSAVAAAATVNAPVGLAGSSEGAALAALRSEGYRGFFAENWLWRALFGLAFWDIVYAPVPGAFLHGFQWGPRDLYDGFRGARAEAVEERLGELANRSDLLPLLELWERKRGTASALVPFDERLRPDLELALRTLSGAELAAVCDRLSRDLRRYGCGLPDLFLTHPQRERLLLAEVKAPGDALRPEQRGWLAHFVDCGIPATVLRLEWDRTGQSLGPHGAS